MEAIASPTGKYVPPVGPVAITKATRGTAVFPYSNLEGQIRSAKSLREKGDMDGAVMAFAQHLMIAPDDARLVGEYGNCLVQQGRSADADALLQRAAQINQNDAAVYSALGVA